jgi:hypothetical protein
MNLPKTFDEAVEVALNMLDASERSELSKIEMVNPHARYRTDFIQLVGNRLGLLDGSNVDLLKHIAVNQASSLHFLEIEGGVVEPMAAVRVVLAEMARRA